MSEELLSSVALRAHFEERIAALERVGLPRPDAEQEAVRSTATLALNRGYLWSSLRSALSPYPELQAIVPDKPGPVDILPSDTPEFTRRGVGWQGTFTGN